MCSDCTIYKLIDAFNSSQNYLSNDLYVHYLCVTAVMVEELIAGGQANVTTFTQGGHGYGEEDSMALHGAPQHPDMAGGDGMHMGGVCVVCVGV